MIEIRKATIDDIEQVLDIAEKFAAASDMDRFGLIYEREKARPFFGLMLKTDSFFILVAEKEKKIIGAIIIGMMPWFCNSGLLCADEMGWWVDPEEKGQGTGARLIKTARAMMQERGVSLCVMNSLAGDEGQRVNRFYRKMGMQPYSYRWIWRM